MQYTIHVKKIMLICLNKFNECIQTEFEKDAPPIILPLSQFRGAKNKPLLKKASNTYCEVLKLYFLLYNILYRGLKTNL